MFLCGVKVMRFLSRVSARFDSRVETWPGFIQKQLILKSTANHLDFTQTRKFLCHVIQWPQNPYQNFSDVKFF